MLLRFCRLSWDCSRDWCWSTAVGTGAAPGAEVGATAAGAAVKVQKVRAAKGMMGVQEKDYMLEELKTVKEPGVEYRVVEGMMEILHLE